MSELVKFVIAGQQRTGSTMLVLSLDQHANICCRGELFIKVYPNTTRASYEAYIRQSIGHRARHLFRRKYSTTTYLNEIFSAPRSLFTDDDKWRNCKAVGFKMMYEQAMKHPAAWSYFRDGRFQVILLARRNPLRILLSRRIRRQTGVVNRMSNDDVPSEISAPDRIKVDVTNLLRTLENLASINQRWEKLASSMSSMRVNYEDMERDMPREIDRILDFLGMPRQPGLEPPTVKLNAAAIADIVTNYEEVAERLRGSAFEWCLAD